MHSSVCTLEFRLFRLLAASTIYLGFEHVGLGISRSTWCRMFLTAEVHSTAQLFQKVLVATYCTNTHKKIGSPRLLLIVLYHECTRTNSVYIVKRILKAVGPDTFAVQLKFSSSRERHSKVALSFQQTLKCRFSSKQLLAECATARNPSDNIKHVTNSGEPGFTNSSDNNPFPEKM